LLTVEWLAKYGEAVENFDGLIEIGNEKYFFLCPHVFVPTRCEVPRISGDRAEQGF
jgi:hypothetical protein